MSAPVTVNPPRPADENSGPKYGSFDVPPCPLPPDLRSDVAASRAEGHSWALIGAVLRYNPDALRRACEDDPAYEPAEEKAFVAARRSLEAEALQRLRRLMASESEKVALEAVKVSVRFGAECRKDEVRDKAEETRAGTARLKVYAQKPHLWADGPPRPRALPAERGPADRFAGPPRGAAPPDRTPTNGEPVSGASRARFGGSQE